MTKFLFILIFLTSIEAFSKGYGQTKISLSLQNTDLKTAFKEIEKKSEFNFLYLDKDVLNTPRIIIQNFKNEPIDKVLESLLFKTNLVFQFSDNNTILISKKNEVTNAIRIKGQVRDESGNLLPGVTVTVKGGNIATSTDGNGEFNINIPEGSTTLIFSSTGFQTQELAIGSSTMLNVKLIAQVNLLNEVIVAGYVTQRKSDITSAISVVDTKELEKQAGTTIAEKLQGRASGVRVRTSGSPGQQASIEIRGVNNFRGTAPLYVIDGLLTNETRDLNPNDVESIQVLKDAGAAALYGSRGANGVIVITTKKGKAGPVRIDFDSKYGTQSIGKRYDLMKATEWSQIINTMYTASNQPVPGSALNPPGGVDTDWQSALIKRGSIQDHNLALSGGSDQGSYRVSGNYFANDGTIQGPSFKRYSSRINTTFNRGKFKFSQSLFTAISNSVDPVGTPFINVIRMVPAIPVYYKANPGGFGYGDVNAPTKGENPVAHQLLNPVTNESLRLQGTVSGEYAFTSFLSYKINLGIEYNANTLASLKKDGAWLYAQGPTNSIYSEDRNRFMSTLFEHTLIFKKSFNKHNLNALAGFTDQFRTFSNSQAKTENLGVDGNGQYFDVLSSGQTQQTASGTRSESSIRSFLGRIDYSYDNRYIISGSIRRDGSSRFSSENRWGNFPSVSLGWRVINEKFAKNILPSVVSDLKLRASYGSLGNTENIGDYEYQAYINTFTRYILGNSQQVIPGAITRTLVNKNIKWETSSTSNFGLDLGFFNNKLQVQADYYSKTTRDILLNAPIPWTTGNGGADPLVNIGSLRNRGLDLSINYNNKVGDFTYGISTNLTTVSNKVLSLTQDNAPVYGTYTITEVGKPVGQFFVLQTDGIFQNDQEVAASAQKSAKPGDQRYKDINGRDEKGKLNGKPNGIIDADDRTYSGSPWPDFTYSFNFDLSYKLFDFTMFWNGVQGGKLYNQANEWMSNTADLGNYRHGLNPWTPQNASTTTPKAIQGAAGVIRPDTDRWLENGSFLRLANLQVGFRLGKALTARLKTQSVRFFMSAQNLLTRTSYTGLDPDIQGGGILSRGYDNGSYPNVKSWITGIQVKF